MFSLRNSFARFFIFALLISMLAVAACDNKPAGGTKSGTPSDKVDDEVMVIESSLGKIVIEFFPGDAPKHVEAFKKLARDKAFDGTAFHRVIPNTIIQGGDPNSKAGDQATWGMGAPGQPTIPAEFNSRNHLRGIVSAARKGDDVNSATSQFFICLTAKPEWDNQYTIFGRVVEGINNVEIISNAPTAPGTERPAEKVTMDKVYLDKRSNYGPTPTYK